MADIIKYNSRITLKYDSITEWNKVKDTFIPLKGEVCIINPASGTYTNTTCLIKIGDGSTKFAQLPYLSAVAADVYNWAKKSAAEFAEWATDDGKKYADSPKLATRAQIDALDVRVSALEDWRDDLGVEDVTASGTAEVAVTSVTQADGKITVTKANLPTVAQVGTTTAGSLEFIDSIKQDKGKITATKRELPKATAGAYGVVKIGVEVPALQTFTTHESDYSAFKDDINSYRETTGSKRWKDAPNGNIIATTYATKDELQTLSDTIGNLSNVMNFRGVVTPSTGKDDPNNDSAALEAFVAANNNVPFSHGDVIVYGNKEYVYVVNGDTGSFVEFGDTQAEEQRLTLVESAVTDLQGRKAFAQVNSCVADDAADTLTIAGGTGITVTDDAANDKITITHSNVTRDDPDTLKPAQLAHGDKIQVVTDVDSNDQGHVTAVTLTEFTLPSASSIGSDISDLQNHVWRTETTSVKAQAAAGAYTSTSDLTSLAKSDLTIATKDIGYIIWDCGSATTNV